MQVVDQKVAKNEYVQPQVVELGSIAEITLGAIYGGSSAPCVYEIPVLK